MKKNKSKIAIVGMSCRFGGAESLDAYWQALIEGKPLFVKDTRLGTGKVGGFLKDIKGFDAEFFRISPNEAQCMDPQQRVLLEITQHAIESSSLSPTLLRKLNCGVFTASLPGDYKFIMAEYPEKAFSAHSFSGNAVSSMSGRISYFYDFSGPSLTLDTACSSSLTALNEAILNIQAGNCGAALVGAVSIFSTSEIFNMAQNSNILSQSGKCSPFSDAADGLIPAEGACTIVLMRLDEAITHGANILATIEGAGLGHNGLSHGLMAPNAKAQAKLIRNVHQRHNISPAEIAYVETHGTGTLLGDSLEIRGLHEGIAPDFPVECYLGAAKSVIGHTLVCSGLASIVKVLLSFENGVIPPQKCQGNSIDLGPFKLNNQAIPLPTDKPLVAVSAFGFTGSNAHVVLRRPPANSYLKRVKDLYSFNRKPYWIGEFKKNLTSTKNTNDTLTKEICGRIATLLGYTEDQISPNHSLLDYGVDSISAIEILAHFRKATGFLSAQDLFNFRSIYELASAISLCESPQDAAPIDEPGANDDLIKFGLQKSAYVDPTGVLTWVHSQKAGKPLLLLPPLNCSYAIWIQQLHVLAAKGWQAHIPIYPGHSSHGAECSQEAIEKCPREIAQYVRAFLDLKSIDAVGWSLGGCFAVAVAAQFPSVIRSLYLVSMAAKFTNDIFEKTIAMQDELVDFKEVLKILYESSSAKSESTSSIAKQIGAGASLAVLKHYYEFLANYNTTANLKDICCRAVIVNGELDQVIREWDVQELATIPGSQIVNYQRQGHYSPLTNAKVFNKHLIEFLEHQ